eukprot:124365-Pelagomonas_calceolata.AAC.1
MGVPLIQSRLREPKHSDDGEARALHVLHHHLARERMRCHPATQLHQFLKMSTKPTSSAYHALSLATPEDVNKAGYT